ncbi:glutamine--fructose-6-phosphate transaminase (isomerizing) [Pseudofrankia sp. BMG5.37]|uniref:glutamine--fructose-6-phosphate transaminase (isomerizing) n=1 Tax=Pseudofrankia sp. BMG5.37 TaxID=3050035 RepID=UPI002893EE7B|nr:glutamine--fructose-6-phosphate transaminase (isomerizing) [Pseudofrankia sp. BMG5.37]MDT3438038.1 glutamine--fructose-6-phosphate transaminase (isomerizing) [Pseudofrankia sp. BMG5.37]
MCGIVAYIGRRPAVPLVVDGLRRLEYRGYDSAGLAIPDRGDKMAVHKTAGRVDDLAARLPKRLTATTAIGHTRWATHGVPSDVNAHPHLDTAGRVAVVHNGIVENAAELRARLTAEGVVFASDTDTEVLAHLIAREFAAGERGLADAVRITLGHIAGTYGIAVLDATRPDEIVVARNGSPLLLGVGEREVLAASDLSALVTHTRRVVHLQDGDLAVLRAGGYEVHRDGAPASRVPEVVDIEPMAYELGPHPHWMHKEIHEQPAAVERALTGRIDDRFATAHLGGLGLSPRETREIRRVVILGCGSAYLAGRLGAQLVEEIARIPASAEPAAEFRYRNPVIEPDTLYVAVSQSGETYDTLSAVQEVQRKGGRVVGVVGMVGSAIARECGSGIYLHAGPEVSVTSTKTYTATAVAFALLALHLGRVRDLSPADGRRLIAGLRALPGQIAEILASEEQIREVAARWASYPGMLYVGRVRGAVVASEGALKLKEVAYLHAEAYPASELKHGPLALISPDRPVVAVIPDDELRDKNLGTVAEVKARDGRVLAVGHDPELKAAADEVLVVPRNEPELDPVLLGIPLQLLAYHAAVTLGHDVDRPRNLAKSVTVE